MMTVVFCVRELFTVASFRLVNYDWESTGNYKELSRQRVFPKCPPRLRHWEPGHLTDSFDVSNHFSESELQDRKYLIQEVFQDNARESESIQIYLEEAYYFVPVHIALQLQQHGNYTAALDWFRTVYDYQAPIDRRKISYVLEKEKGISHAYERAKDWLLDPLNPHRIAATRRNSYMRFTLQALARCFLEYADAEFSLDTAESMPRARTLYATTLELLEENSLKQQTSSCDDLIRQMILDVGRQVEILAPAYKGSWKKIVRKLYKIKDRQTLSETIGKVPTTDQPMETLIKAVLDLVGEAESTGPVRMMANVAIRREKVDRMHAALFSVDRVADAIGESLGDLTPMLGKLPADALVSERYEPLGPERTTRTASGLYDYQPMISFGFCIPANPVLAVLRLKAELNLYKIRTCRNIAGMERQLDPYSAPTDTVSGLPQIGEGGQLVLPGTVTLQPTPYRYQVLVERAKQLVQMAAQFEAAMLAALEKRDAEYYQRLKANQELQLTRQGVRLQELRVREAEDGVTLAELQRDRGQILVETYQEWIEAGLNEYESQMINFYHLGAIYKSMAASLTGTITGIEAMSSATMATYALAASVLGLAIGRSVIETFAIGAEVAAQVASVWAAYERRQDEWELQKKVADQDIKIGEQQITLANDRVRVVGQERKIAEMQADHAQEVVDYLTTKFTNVELYDWMSGMLEGVYSFFLQQATAMARLAENQVAFERQQIPPAYIQADYWEAPGDMVLGLSEQGNGPDRRGLTGSARLLEDIHQLDLYAFKTDQRKLQLTKTISLAHLAPDIFERFRQTGIMLFQTPMKLFDRDFPGHYLRLIKRISTSVLALIPPTEGIHATLSTTGLSRVVIGNDGLFQQIEVRRYPESVALTSPINATGLFELLPQNQEMLLPFEAMGVDTFWEFRLPKAANRFGYRTLMDVLITIDYTALDDFAYRQQVIRELDDTVSGDRPLSFRHDLPDQWYSLHHPEQTGTPMVVRFETRRADFPPNIEELSIQHLLLYFVRADGATFEVPNASLRLTEPGGTAPLGGAATTVEGLISTRSGSASSWLTMTGKSPIGQWELALPNSAEVRNRFTNSEIEDILFVITYEGSTPPWPA